MLHTSTPQTIKYLLLTYHTSSNSNRDQVLKFDHIPLGLLVEGIDEVTDCLQEGNQQKNLHVSYQLLIYSYIQLA